MRIKKAVSDSSKGIERRVDKRLEIALPIKLLNHEVKSKNISPGGVYFEETADNIEEYSLGETTMIKIVTSVSNPGLPSKTVELTGIGMVMRIDKIDSHHKDKKFGVALKFSERPKIDF
ncbi:MAG: hypothetical protein ACE5GU_04115 [Candidatus Scalinduaceae bacterium]